MNKIDNLIIEFEKYKFNLGKEIVKNLSTKTDNGKPDFDSKP